MVRWVIGSILHGGPISRSSQGNVLFNDALNTFYLRIYERKAAAATWATLSD